MKSILCAVDHSEPSLRAARFAVALAARCNAHLVLLTVVRPVDADADEDIEAFRVREHIHDPTVTLVLDEATAELAALRAQLAEADGPAIACEVRTGAAAPAIISFARDHPIDLIVVGHRGHGRLGGWLTGSVAKRVVDLAPCPVLVAR